MFYSKNGTACFGPYWTSSDFYNIKEESIKAVKLCEGVLIERSLRQSPDHPVPNAKSICKKRDKICKQREEREKKCIR